MRSAITILSLVAAITAEAPYHLPRPAAHAPAFHYPSAPAPPPPPPPPPHPIPQFSPQFAPQPLNPNFGYQYQQPNFRPAFVQHAPAPAPAPQPIQYQPQPQPAYIPTIPHPQPIAYPQSPQSQQIAYQPPSTSYGIPQPNIVSRPILSQPQGEPIQPFHSAAPQLGPLPLQVGQSQPIPQLQSQSIPQFQTQPLPQFEPQPIPQFRPQPGQVYQPIAYPQQQFTAQHGYSYQQSQAGLQHIAQVPLQAQPFTQIAPDFSSYQADSNLYSNEQAQTHREALDSVVVDRVQNIIKDDEHSSARNAGYLSLVSGVSLENAKPSVEVSSFVHTSPLNIGQKSSGASRTSVSSLSADYGLPSAVTSSQLSQSSSSFLPHTQPATSYGPPK